MMSRLFDRRSYVSILLLSLFAPLGSAEAAGLGPAFGIGKPWYAPAAGDQRELAIARGTSGALVVWTSKLSASSTTTDIQAARLSSTGELLDTRPLSVTYATKDQRHPAVAFNGTEYLVVWEDCRNTTGTGCLTPDIYGARISASGQVLDSGGIPIATVNGFEESPSVASNGTDFLVVYQQLPTGTEMDIRAVPVTSGGVVGSSFVVSAAAGSELDPAVAFNGAAYVVTWANQGSTTAMPPVLPGIYAARVSTAGAVLDSPAVTVSATAGVFFDKPAIAVEAGVALVAWSVVTDFTGNGQGDVRAARLSQQGAVLDTGGFAVTTANGLQANAAVDFDGSHFVVAWYDGPAFKLKGTRVQTDGTVLDVNGIALASSLGYAVAPALSSTGSGSWVVYDRSSSSTVKGAWGALVSPTLVASAPIPVASSGDADLQSAPDIAFDGTNHVVVWSDTRAPSGIWGALVSTAGVVAGGDSFFIGDGVRPQVASNGVDSLVVFNYRAAYDRVYGARVSKSGQVSATFSIYVPFFEASNPVIAWNGHHYLVAWQEYVNSALRVSAVRLDGTGALVDAAPFIVNSNCSSPKVASASDQWLVVCEAGSQSDLVARRVSAAGVVLDATAFTVTGATGSQLAASVGGAPNGYFVAWQDSRAGFTPAIYGARVTTAGLVEEPNGILLGDVGLRPDVTFDGTRYVVGWTYWNSGGMRATRVNLAGAREETANGITLGTSDVDDNVAWCSNGAGTLLAVWEHGTGTGCFGTVACAPRLTARAGTLRGALGATCSSSADCETSACSMGVCGGSGTADAGAPDAGPVDAGFVDAGEADAGEMISSDSGTPLPMADAGVDPPPVPDGPSGCGCQGTTGGAFALLAMAIGARRRRSMR